MNGIFARALGADFGLLHPTLQERFGLDPQQQRGCRGVGTMDQIWRGRAHVRPFLAFGTLRNILFPETGENVGFQIDNYCYLDTYGRATTTFVRTFEVARGRRRRFDATMVWSEERGCIVDYIGTHQHIAVDLQCRVRPDGGLHIRTGEQRCHEGLASFRMPPWMSGVAQVDEWYDEESDRMRIEVRVDHPRFGPIFGYRGSFTNTVLDLRQGIPAAVKPYREEIRD